MKGIIKVIPFLSKYKFVLIVILAGVLLLLLPTLWDSSSGQASESVSAGSPEDFSVETLEERLSTALSEVEGAGNVTVVLTVKSGTRKILAEDTESSDGDNSSKDSTETVIISTSSNTEEAVLIQQIYPTFQGALVICPGADDPAIKLALTQAVSALTGLGSDKISICKGK